MAKKLILFSTFLTSFLLMGFTTYKQDPYLVQGEPVGMTQGDFTLIADNTVLPVDGYSQILLRSDNTTATNRTFTLPTPKKKGHDLFIIFYSGSSTTADLQSSGNVKLANGAAWQPVQYDNLRLVYDGTYWQEVARSNISTGALDGFSLSSPSAADLLLYQSGTATFDNKAMSGDATIAATGALTIANSAITNAKVDASAAIAYSKLNLAGSVLSTDISSSDGARKIARVSVAYTDLTTAGTGVAFVSGVTIPDNAIILRTYYDVTTTFAGDGDDSSTIKIGIEDQDNDVVAAVAIKTATDWDIGLHEGIQDGAMANALKLTAARQVAVTWTAVATDTTLNAGAMDVFVEYVIGQ